MRAFSTSHANIRLMVLTNSQAHCTSLGFFHTIPAPQYKSSVLRGAQEPYLHNSVGSAKALGFGVPGDQGSGDKP